MTNQFITLKKTLPAAIMLVLCCTIVSFAFAQKLPTKAEVENMGLSFSAGKIPAYFSSSYRERINEVRPLAEEMLTFYKDNLQLQDSFTIVMLDIKQWQEHIAGLPYGLLLVKNHMAFIPATADGVLNKGTLALKDSVKPATLKKIKKSGYSFEQAAEVYTDLILLHELGHSLTKEFGINTINNQVLTEFLASYFAYSFLARKHPKLASLFEAMVTDVYLDAYTPTYTSWADFERLFLNVGPNNYSWYQAKFLKKGIEVYKRQQLGFLRAMKKNFPLNDSDGVSNEWILDKLISIDKKFMGWKKGF